MARSDTIKPRRPAASVNPVPIWPTPEKTNLVFWVEKNGTLPENKGWALKDSYSDRVTYPDHKLVYVSPEDVDGWSRWYYASDRVYEDNYNWEFTQANIGGQTFDAVQRTYLIPREDFTEATPAAGAAMPRDPEVGDPAAYMFPTGYVLAGRRQQRTGDDMFDGVYVVEVRDYVKKTTITSERYDPSTNGPLQTVRTLYFRGEIYTGAVTIEDATVLSASTVAYWQPVSGGQISEFQQLSADAWAVTTQDLIPQFGLPATPNPVVFGGTMLREYDTSINYTWPDVLGADGSTVGSPGGAAVSGPFEITTWAYKDGGSRYYLRPTYKRTSYHGPCPAKIHEEWLTQAQLDTAAGVAAGNPGSLFIGTVMQPRRILYVAPHLSANIAPALHVAAYIQADTGSNDPVWGVNVNTRRDFPATTDTDWPASLVAEVSVTPVRGGYLVRRVTVYQPRFKT